jgi:predicted nucleotidyltransferase
MTLAEADLAWIVERVRAGYDATAIFLFGSCAREAARPGSDIDLLIVGPSGLPRARRGRAVAAALAAFPAHFDLLFYTQAELTEECADRHSFMASVMASAQAIYPR